MKNNIVNANIVTAFNARAIGTKVTRAAQFYELLDQAISDHLFPVESDRAEGIVKGQAFIMLPEPAQATVSAGVGRRQVTLLPAQESLPASAFVAREHRGRVGLFLKRQFAAAVENVAAVVYTKEAYLADPDVAGDSDERARVANATHVLVAILAFAGPKAPLSPVRFVHNLAGGNKNTAGLSGDSIRKQAEEIKAYDDAWCVVAD